MSVFCPTKQQHSQSFSRCQSHLKHSTRKAKELASEGISIKKCGTTAIVTLRNYMLWWHNIHLFDQKTATEEEEEKKRDIVRFLPKSLKFSFPSLPITSSSSSKKMRPRLKAVRQQCRRRDTADDGFHLHSHRRYVAANTMTSSTPKLPSSVSFTFNTAARVNNLIDTTTASLFEVFFFPTQQQKLGRHRR